MGVEKKCLGRFRRLELVLPPQKCATRDSRATGRPRLLAKNSDNNVNSTRWYFFFFTYMSYILNGQQATKIGLELDPCGWSDGISYIMMAV